MEQKKIGAFEKGNKAAAGKRSGGRPPDWLKSKCRDLIDKKKLVEFLAEVAASDEFDVRDRLRATELLMDRGWGKPAQEVQHSGEVGVSLFDLIDRAEKERGAE